MVNTANLIGATLGLGLATIGAGQWWLCHWSRRLGYTDAAERIYEDIRMYREEDGQIFTDLVPGLTEGMYIARYHARNYNTMPTGLSRSRRPSLGPQVAEVGKHRGN